MQLVVNVHASWLIAQPGPLARLMGHVQALEGVCPWSPPPPPRAPGEDLDQAEDLGQLLDGLLEGPEPEPGKYDIVTLSTAPRPEPVNDNNVIIDLTPQPAPVQAPASRIADNVSNSAAPPPARPRPAPPAAVQAPSSMTGRSLYKWACAIKALPKVNALGRARNFPRIISDWSPEMVAEVFGELTSSSTPSRHLIK